MHAIPQYTLLTEISSTEPGLWRFALQRADGETELDITDIEPEMGGERLELLTLVRGLEALDQPSKVTVATASRYVRYGVEHGLAEWRDNGWVWECYGRMVPVRDAELWQRVERAGRIHEIRCGASLGAAGRSHRLDAPHREVPPPEGRRTWEPVWEVVQAWLPG